jgi:hypothetical protein|tara:strand:+ start:178 stop:822 length:645 start_codon:yes stop_codon:yes gene_type:complete
MKKKIITRTTQVSSKSKKFESMLRTEITTGVDIDIWAQRINHGHDIDVLVEDVRQEALTFLDSHKIPYAELPAGDLGCLPPEWLAKYDHISGVREAFGMLFELHAFNQARKLDRPEAAYSHLLRIVPRQQLITIARMEARYFAGQARQGDGFKSTEKEERRSRMFYHYCQLRDDGKSSQESRRISAKRLGISERTKRTYWKIDEIEAKYQAYTN